MANQKKYLFLLSLILTTACSGPKFIKRDNITPLNNTNFSSINGYYKNHTTDTAFTTDIALWDALNPKRKKTYLYDTAVKYKNAKIEVQLKDNKTLLVKLYNGSNLIDEKKYKGKIKKSYFSVRRRIKYFGLPFLFLTYFDYKFRIGKDISNNLLLDAMQERDAWLLVFVSGSNSQHNLKFQAQ
jgi:hypothetical protein